MRVGIRKRGFVDWRSFGAATASCALLLAFSASIQAAETTSFEYDAQGRLTQSTRAGGPSDGTIKSTSYDKAGNRTNQTVTGAGSAMMAGGGPEAMALSAEAEEAEPTAGGAYDDESLPDPLLSDGAPYVGEAPPAEVTGPVDLSGEGE